LHPGHMSLVEASKAECDFTVVSIYINPAQFSAGEDLDTYPRNMEADRTLLEAAHVDVLFLPRTLYPEGFKTAVHVNTITESLCGQSRPDYFQGVATVVLKLLNIVRPHKAFFGEKDRQQLEVVKTMVRDLDMDTAIVPCPIYREPDGLAMSSRNNYLSPEERISARCLSAALQTGQTWVNAGETSAAILSQKVRDIIETEKNARVEYISLCDSKNFTELNQIGDESLLALAIWIGKTRLIDNCILGSD
jgi:pantoate--beta-alanine ligase